MVSVKKTTLNLPDNRKITVYTDEVGRGSLIYDVVAAAVIMPCEYAEDDRMVGLIKDSKKCTHKRLLELSTYIKDTSIAWGVGTASVEEIDEHNILNASMIAMHRALDAVYEQVKFEHICVDGNRFRTYMTPNTADFVTHQCIVSGDATELGIAAASIVAKVHRDTCVEKIASDFPDLDARYSWHSNKGYGTKAHMDALSKHGPTIYHRLSFKPVAEAAKVHGFTRRFQESLENNTI